MSEALRLWLTQELDTRRLSHRELARQANISNTLVSRVLSGKMPPSADFCINVAIALERNPIELLRLADIIPPRDDTSLDDAITHEIIRIVRTLSQDKKEKALSYLRFLLAD